MFDYIVLSLSEFESFMIHPPELSGSNQQRHLLEKQEKVHEKWPNFAYKVSFHTCRQHHFYKKKKVPERKE
jgi:hypothetical protein